MEEIIQNNLWNSRELKPPRIHFENLSLEIKKTIKKAINTELAANNYRHQIYTEMITLSKFLSQRKNKYRSDKGFKTIQKVNKVVNRIYQLDLQSSLTLIKLNLIDTFVPSKQLFQWLLVKLQSYAKLLHHGNDCSYYSATMLNHRLRTGHNWVEVMTALSMISRIWAVTNFLMKRVCSTYDQLLSVLDHLPIDHSEKNWNCSHEFPHDLKNWLSSDCDIFSDEDLNSKTPRKHLAKIKSPKHLQKFLILETKRRSKTKQTCISQHLDALQWHMFSKRILKWIKILEKSDTQRRRRLLKKINSRISTWLS